MFVRWFFHAKDLGQGGALALIPCLGPVSLWEKGMVVFMISEGLSGNGLNLLDTNLDLPVKP